MKTSRIVTLLLLLLLFSFICDIENKVLINVSEWASQFQLKSDFDFSLPSIDLHKYSRFLHYLK